MRVRDQWIDSFKDDLYLALIESDENPTIEPDARRARAAFDGVVEALRNTD
jgi:hypothetical protein